MIERDCKWRLGLFLGEPLAQDIDAPIETARAPIRISEACFNVNINFRRGIGPLGKFGQTPPGESDRIFCQDGHPSDTLPAGRVRLNAPGTKRNFSFAI